MTCRSLPLYARRPWRDYRETLVFCRLLFRLRYMDTRACPILNPNCKGTRRTDGGPRIGEGSGDDFFADTFAPFAKQYDGRDRGDAG